MKCKLLAMCRIRLMAGAAVVMLTTVSSMVLAEVRYTVTDLGLRLGTADGPKAVNDLGQVVGYQNLVAYRWEAGAFTWTGPSSSMAKGTNNQGQIVGSISNRAVVWNDGVPTYLVPQSSWSFAYDINESGAIVGYYDDGSLLHYRPFIWHDGVLTNLTNADGSAFYGYGYAINADGDIVGDEGFLWRDGEIVSLPVLPGCAHAYASDINDQGQVLEQFS